MLSSDARGRDVLGNTVPESMLLAEGRLEELSEATTGSSPVGVIR